jgi:quercetin dioxygenase-like cupin family protein
MTESTTPLFFQINDEVKWQDAGPGIQRQVFGYNESLMLVKVRFERGAVGAMHQHPHSQASYVESGRFELTIGDEKRILSKADGYFVPPNVVHGCTCLEEGILIDVFNPLREDFLK